jgi:copper transporter 1
MLTWFCSAIAVVTDHSARHSPSLSDSVQCHKDAPPSVTNDPLSSQSPNPATPRRSPRTIAPFLLAVDVPRGVLHAAQTLLRYIIMLAIMCASSLPAILLTPLTIRRTFQAAYLIALVAGAGVGELLFGRYGGYKAGDH